MGSGSEQSSRPCDNAVAWWCRRFLLCAQFHQRSIISSTRGSRSYTCGVRCIHVCSALSPGGVTPAADLGHQMGFLSHHRLLPSTAKEALLSLPAHVRALATGMLTSWSIFCHTDCLYSAHLPLSAHTSTPRTSRSLNSPSGVYNKQRALRTKHLSL